MGEFVVLVGGALFRDGKLLVMKRADSKKFLPGFFEIPGGKVEFGEDLIAALKREFSEETSLEIEVLRPYNVWSWTSGNAQCIEVDYLVTCNDVSRLRLSSEHSASLWIQTGEKIASTMEMVRTIEKAFVATNSS